MFTLRPLRMDDDGSGELPYLDHPVLLALRDRRLRRIMKNTLSMLEHRFGETRLPSVGVELELQLVDVSTLATPARHRRHLR